MANFKDYYRRMGVSPTAGDLAIKAAFRRLARRHHPDVALDKRSARRFPGILEAYEVLSDPERRRHYDRVYRDRKAASQPRGAEARRVKRDGRAGTASRRFGLAIDLFGLRLGLAVDAERAGKPHTPPSTGARKGPGRSNR
jgi:curved DNA-binding protein CbpA